MSNELPWQVWTPDDLAPPPETFVPVEADNVTLTDDTPEAALAAAQLLEEGVAPGRMPA
ncbi:flagellar assembly protein FliH, partial [Salmonella enterica subsp. enterica serovar Poona]